MSFFAISKTQRKDNSMAYLHSHDYYELYFQISGFRTYFCDNKYYNLSPNTLIVTRPNVLHKFENGPFERYLISVDRSYFSDSQLDFLNSLDEKMLITLDPQRINEILDNLNELRNIENSVVDNKHILLSLKLGLLFHQIYVAQTGTVEPTTALEKDAINYTISPTILKVMDFVQKNYSKKISLNDLCQEYHLSKTWLCKCFLQANNMTIFEYKTMLQINAAKKLLRSSDHSIEKIAQLVGFSSSRHFSSMFKKHNGTTPLHWRKNFRPMEKTLLKNPIK